jgi:hypothetical protein
MDRSTERWRKLVEDMPPEQAAGVRVGLYLTRAHRDDPRQAAPSRRWVLNRRVKTRKPEKRSRRGSSR